MARSARLATYGTGLVLAAVLAAEMLLADAAPAIEAPPPPGPRAAPAVAPPVDAWTDAALERPLFAPGRRALQAGPAAEAALPRLTGTVHDGARVLAIFAADGDGKSVVVGRDAVIAGWTVADIADGVVTLVRDGGTAKLHLGWANAPGAAPAGEPAYARVRAKWVDPVPP